MKKNNETIYKAINYLNAMKLIIENDDEIESEELDALDAACKAFEKFVFENVEKALNEENKNEIE